ncbi:MAG: hypothetical protein JHD20_04810, partial [Gemmataceae bacterium]|nr:hypothetical protein [Gemmataceae bacterium]
MYLFNFLLLSSMLLLGTGAIKPIEKKASFRYPENSNTPNGKLSYISNIPVLEVKGTPEQMGEAIGKL